MKKIIALVTFITLFAFNVFAGDIAVIDVQKIMTDSAAAKSIQDQINKKRDSYQKEISAKEDSLMKENKDLTDKKSKLSQAEMEPKMKDFNDKVMKAQKYIADLRTQLDASYSTSVAELQKSVTEIVEKMATEKKFTVVIPAQQLVYAAKELDITDEVLKRLNDKVKTITVKFETVKEDTAPAAGAAPKKDKK